MLKDIVLFIGALALALGFMLLFFGGTWEGVRFGLELLGAIYILQLAYSVLKKNADKKREQEEVKKITDKYFKSS